MTIKEKCHQCEALMINGVYCHETGCPDAWRDSTRECSNCGTSFKPQQEGQFQCDQECWTAYFGVAQEVL
jgi:hypothetical protein